MPARVAGISISIGGDISALRSATKELTRSITQLARQMQAAFAPARQAAEQVAKATQNAGDASRTAIQKFVSFARKAAEAAEITTKIVEGAKSLKSVYNFLSNTKPFAKFKEAGGGIQGVKAALQGVSQKLKDIASSPGFKKMVVGAALAGGAVLGLTAAVKTAQVAFKVLRFVGEAYLRMLQRRAQMAAEGIRGAFALLTRMTTGGGGGGGGMSGLFGPVAGLVTIGGAIALIGSELTKTFQAAAGFEDVRTRIESFTGSVKASADMMKELAQYGNETPFETITVQESAAQLMSAGIRSNVTGLVKSLGAVSKNDQTLGDLSDALSKGFAKGKFQTEELNKFLERGINLMPELSRVTGLAGLDLTKAIEAGLRFDQVTTAIENMSKKGGDAFGLLNRMAATWNGRVSTLSGAWADLRQAFGQPILDAVKPLVIDATNLISEMRDKAAAAGKAIGEAILQVYALIKSGQSLTLLKAGVTYAFYAGIDVLMRGLRGAVAFLAASLPPIFSALTATITDPRFWQGVGLQMRAFGNDIGAQIQYALADGIPLLGEGTRREMREKAGAKEKGANFMRGQGGRLVSQAGGAVDLAGVIGSALGAGGMAALKSATEMPASQNFQDAARVMKELMNGVSETAKSLKDAAAVPAPEKARGGMQTILSGVQAAARGFMIQTELARIGGGGFGIISGGAGPLAPMVTEQQRTNNHLQDIKKALRSNQGAMPNFGWA